MITIEKLKIYRQYEGDGDMFSRDVNNSGMQLFEKNDWGTIANFEENIELIGKGLTSEEFRNRTIQELQKNFDSIAFIEITKPISSIVLKMNVYSSEQQKNLELEDNKQNEKRERIWWKFWT